MKLLINRFGLYIAWLAAMVATFCSLYASSILKLEPCTFCWYQRIFMFPLVIILGIASYKNDKTIISNIIALPLVGALVAFLQSIFSFFSLATPICGSECIEQPAKLFGIIDFSIASFFTFMFIFFVLYLTNKKQSKK